MPGPFVPTSAASLRSVLLHPPPHSKFGWSPARVCSRLWSSTVSPAGPHPLIRHCRASHFDGFGGSVPVCREPTIYVRPLCSSILRVIAESASGVLHRSSRVTMSRRCHRVTQIVRLPWIPHSTRTRESSPLLIRFENVLRVQTLRWTRIHRERTRIHQGLPGVAI